MRTEHLSENELDRLLAGAELETEAAEHAASCVACRRRRDGFLAVIAEVAAPEPDLAARERAREVALARFASRRPGVGRWWLAAAAALLIAVLVPVAHRDADHQAAITDLDAVLEEVDQVLARDPLTSLAGEEVVRVVVPEVSARSERSVS